MVWISVPGSYDKCGVSDVPACELRTELYQFIEGVIAECGRRGVQFVSKNGRFSIFWRRPRIKQLLRRAGAKWINYDSCSFGTAYRKPQTIAMTTHELCNWGLSLACSCRLPRELLEGKVMLLRAPPASVSQSASLAWQLGALLLTGTLASHHSIRFGSETHDNSRTLQLWPVPRLQLQTAA